MKKSTLLKPGQISTISGIYEIMGKKGRLTGIQRAIDKYEKAPPTLQPGQTFKLAVRTKTMGR